MKLFLLLSIFGIAALGWSTGILRDGIGTTHSWWKQDFTLKPQRVWVTKKAKGNCTCKPYIIGLGPSPPAKSKILTLRECINECEIYEQRFRDGQKSKKT
ncbi:unnamed protein product [Cylicocyclus nassatus]|uniref:Uncharacterized protein n=1 Tax=Cylicocyclus nassatus TaxID=53992 RepID=A0AA36GWS3_CYLNA|nr:unnamed protein product [Cylicocyclus nassatus]CAJ0599791.1 unnamed protein product [Cylicocyclus nassatus]